MRAKKRADQFDKTALTGNRGLAARQFFHHQRVGQNIKSYASGLLRNRNAEKAQLSHFGINVGRKTFVLVKGRGLWPDTAVGKPPRRLPYLQLDIGRQAWNRNEK